MESANGFDRAAVDAQGFVLVGGGSRRMGSDKALLRFRGQRLVDAAACTLEDISVPVHLVLRQGQDWPDNRWSLVRDLRPNCGPMGGIEAALHRLESDYAFVLGCDLPLVSRDLLLELHRMRQPDGLVVPVDSAGCLHPMCSLWGIGTRRAIAEALDSQQLGLVRFVQESSVRLVRLDLREHGFSDSVVTNVNTREDWRTFQETVD